MSQSESSYGSNNLEPSILKDSAAAFLAQTGKLPENAQGVIWPGNRLEVEAFLNQEEIQRFIVARSCRNSRGELNPDERRFLSSVDRNYDNSVRAFEGTNHEFGAELERSQAPKLDFEYGHAIATEVCRGLEQGDIDRQIDRINQVIETSNQILQEEGLAAYNLEGFGSGPINPEKSGESDYKTIQDRYGELVADRARDHFENVEIHQDFAEAYRDKTTLVLARNPK